MSNQVSMDNDYNVTANFDGNIIYMQNNTTLENITFVILNPRKLSQHFSTEQFDKFISQIKNSTHAHLVLIDELNEFKNLEYEKWFKGIINSYSGIWLGENISSQFVLKTNKSIRESSLKVTNDFGFVVTNGNYKYVKTINEKNED